MSNDENPKYPTWYWVVTLLLVFVAYLGQKGVTNLEARIDGKAEKAMVLANQEAVNAELRDIKAQINALSTRQSEDSRHVERAVNQMIQALLIHDPRVASFLKDTK